MAAVSLLHLVAVLGQSCVVQSWSQDWYRPYRNKATRDRRLHKVKEQTEIDTSCQCGVLGTEMRIVNGQEVEVNKYPWMIAIMWAPYEDYEEGQVGVRAQFCGGSIISNRFVLTAAHCIFPGDVTWARAGDADLALLGETPYSTDFLVKKQWVHKQYNDDTTDADIGLLLLEEKIQFNIYAGAIGPICLGTEHMKHYGLEATVAGWGIHEYDNNEAENPSPTQLFETTVDIIWMKSCKRDYGYKKRQITEKMLCAYTQGTDSCQGDSGGPLFFLNPLSNRYEQIGIVSWGSGCAFENFPGIYTKVSEFLIWIAKQTKDSTYCKV